MKNVMINIINKRPIYSRNILFIFIVEVQEKTTLNYLLKSQPSDIFFLNRPYVIQEYFQQD